MGLFNVLGKAVRETGIGLDRIGMMIQGSYAFKETLCRHRRVFRLGDKFPLIKANSWVAPNACVMGAVEIGNSSSIWYGSVIRGDVNLISIGNGSSVGDRCVVHVSSGFLEGPPASTSIGDNTVVEPGSLLHGCKIGDSCLIGSGSILLNRSELGNNSELSPGSVLSEGQVVPEGQLWAGSNPYAQLIRDLTQEDFARIEKTALGTAERAKVHREEDGKSILQREKEKIEELEFSPVKYRPYPTRGQRQLDEEAAAAEASSN